MLALNDKFDSVGLPKLFHYRLWQIRLVATCLMLGDVHLKFGGILFPFGHY